ncbi:TonB-dependent receptor [candidate division KSB1 bacterium]|nr:TonB-dependent receptor [candidate division KSB1 bacterium]
MIRLNKFVTYLFVYFLLGVFGGGLLYAGITGKISGKIIDKQTGSPLVGASVVIEGTNRGAAADNDGNYLILRVPPGTYTLRVMMIGYKRSRVTDVKVYSDRTTAIDVDLEVEVIQGEEVTVVAGREVIEFDRTNTASYVSQDEIEKLPVSSMYEVVQMQAGVITDAGGGLHIRGGRTREVAYFIDGVPVTNTFSQGGGSNVAIENNFIKELQVITGTFNAEYGSAQSGVINVVTKVPESTYDGKIEVISGGYYSPSKPQYIGLNTYKPFNDKEVKFSISGPIPFSSKIGKLGFYLNGRIIDSDGWLNGERRYMPEDGWEIEVFREWYEATYDPVDPLVIPIPDSLHTGDGKIVPINWSQSYNINTKLVYQPTPTITLSYNLFLSKSKGKGYSQSWRFCPDALPYGFSDNATHMLVLTHALTENLYYNLRYSFQENHHKSYTYEDPNDPRYQTNAVNAWDPGKITGYDYGGIYSWDRNFQDREMHLVNGDLTWQINKVIEIKSGFEAKGYDLHYKNAPLREVLGHEILQFPYTKNEIRGWEIPYDYFVEATRNYEFGNIQLRQTSPDSSEDQLFYVDYNREPLEGAGFVQTKLNLKEIILNAGIRLDIFRPKDRFCPDYSIVYPELVGADAYYEQAKMKYQFSPRFGLSFPISDRGAMRLSYGHFFQAPSFEKMYQNPVLEYYNQFSIMNTRIGNPNLKPEKTIQYEVGLQQELIDGLALELTVYYKDIRDLLGTEILTLSNATTFYRYINKEYGNSSGVTLAFNYHPSQGNITASLDYTYMIAKGTASSAEAVRDVSILSGSGQGAYTLSARRIDFLGWDQTHSLNGSVSIRPRQDLYISLLGQLGSGLPYSPSTLDPNIEIPGGWWDNAGRKPLRWNMDLKIYKSFQLLGMKVGTFVNIFNFLNHLDENSVNSITGRAGPSAYLPEIARKRYSRLEQLGEFTRDEADYNPTDYSRPRLIQLGLSFEL